jgi:hypothetical protein
MPEALNSNTHGGVRGKNWRQLFNAGGIEYGEDYIRWL